MSERERQHPSRCVRETDKTERGWVETYPRFGFFPVVAVMDISLSPKRTRRQKAGGSFYASRIGKREDDSELGLLLESVPCFLHFPPLAFKGTMRSVG